MKKTQTIFDLIASVTSRTEPFHSMLLAWFLDHDTGFLQSFLSTFVPVDFLTANNICCDGGDCVKPDVHPEFPFKTGERLDVLLEFDQALIGIEVKTVDASTTEGQLDSYWNHLTESPPHKSVFLVYLTPFSAANIPEGVAADRVHAVTEFENFSASNPNRALHVNWGEVVSLYPTEAPSPLNNLYQQHRDYVERIVCDPALFDHTDRARGLGKFFGHDTVHQFFTELEERGITYEDTDADIVLPRAGNAGKVTDIIEVLSILIESEQVDCERQAKSKSDVSEKHRSKYLSDDFGGFYDRLFKYFDTVQHLWLQGKDRIGVRVAHKKHSSGVSVCTLTNDSILIRKER